MIQSATESPEIPKKSGKSAGKTHLWKLGLLQTSLLCLLALIVIRLFYLQIVRSSDLQIQARRQYESRIELKPRRGTIYDRNGNALATTVMSYSYAIDPKMGSNPAAIAKVLARVTKDSASVWQAKIQSCTTSFLWLLRGVSAQIPELDSLKSQGIIRIEEPRRRYSYGSIAGQIVGASNVDNVGISGVELAFDTILRGKPGFAMMLRDGRGSLRSALGVPGSPPANGADVVTTLDIRLQQIIEYELQRGIEDAQAASGIVVAIEPTTGEIKALCSFPSFDPNAPGASSPDATRIRAVSDIYEPGSTFKIVGAAASIEEGIISPADSVDGEGGSYHVGDFEVKDSHPLGKVTFRQALEQSSNIVFAKQAKKIPDGKFYKYTRDFGFGVVTGSDLPGEITGVLKKPKQFDNTTKMFMGYGYELSASALQIANGYAVVANGGVMMKPYIVKEVRSDDGLEYFSAKPQIVRRVISSETAKTLTDMLRGVVERGTGVEARVPGLNIAGKTGTAQQVIEGVYSKKAYTASFAGFFPAEAPKLVVVIMLDRPQTDIYGGKTAAPIFRRIAERWIGGTGTEVATGKPTTTQPDSAIVPEVRGLSDENAKQLLHTNGLRMKPMTAGVVVRQDLPPGMKVERGHEIILEAQPFRSQSGNQQQPLTRPDVRGIPVRRALTILHNAGVMVKVFGNGKVVKQTWSGTEKAPVCSLECGK